MLTSLCVLAALLCADDAESSTPTPDPDRAAQVRTLMRQLDAAQLAQRDEAEAKLIELGPAILPDLPEEQSRMSAEVKLRLGRIRQTLLKRRSEQFAEATHVTLTEKNVPLSEVLTAIQKQTGNSVRDLREEMEGGVPDTKVSVAFEGTPFWAAVDTLLDDAELGVYDYHGNQELGLVRGHPNDLERKNRAHYQGAFRIEARRIDAHRELTRDLPGTVTVVLGVAWEPRLAPIGLKLPLEEIDVVDSEGDAVTVDSQGGEIEAILTPKSVSSELEIVLEAPPREVEQLAKLEGTITALVPGGIETFEFDGLDKARDVKQRKAGAQVTLEGMIKNNELWEARVVVTFDDPGTALESHRGWVFDNEAYLLDPDGKRMEHDGFQTTLQSDDAVGVGYLFDLPNGPAGYKLVYKTAVTIMEVPVQFELKDLPLP